MSSFDIPTLERRLLCAVRRCAGEGVFVIGSGPFRGETWEVCRVEEKGGGGGGVRAGYERGDAGICSGAAHG